MSQNTQDLRNKNYGKSDIRSYGCFGSKSKVRTEIEQNNVLLAQVEAARSAKPKTGVLPDVSSRLMAGRTLDKVERNKPIHIPEHGQTLRRCIQKNGNLAIVGADVVSLFPSLRNIESARLARHAILQSKLSFESVDYHRALQYIYIVGGKELLQKAGLGRLTPTWLGDRADLITIGGKKSNDRENWRNSCLDMFNIDGL